jgi:hypothetical protein
MPAARFRTCTHKIRLLQLFVVILSSPLNVSTVSDQAPLIAGGGRKAGSRSIRKEGKKIGADRADSEVADRK